MLLPLSMMWHRVHLARDDSDTTLFLHLLYAGEMLTKLVTAGLVAAVSDDRDRHRYRLLHRLIRADGLGGWAQTLEEVLGGPPAQHLLEAATEDRRSLTERFRSGSWQYDAVDSLVRALRTVAANVEPLPTRVPLRQWFAGFVTLRNTTRGHGATTPEVSGKLAPDLERSINIIVNHLPILQKPWAYLHRNLSGKFRVVSLGGDISAFDQLKTYTGGAQRHRHLSDGVYIDFGEYTKVDLIDTSIDVSDFFFPNGGFKGTTFELLSLVSDNRKQGDASPYLAPAGERPSSETHGKGTLSNTANWLNSLLHNNSLAIDSDEKRLPYRKLTRLMEERKEEADATDLSRLAWLYLHLRDPDRAREIAEQGLAIGPENEHCDRLIKRLGRSAGSAEDVAGWLI